MNSLYDLWLGDVASLQSYRCRTFLRDSAPLVSSRFSTGQAGQSDLDLLKVEGIKNLAGGMFQREHEDDQKAARVLGLFNKFNERVYPAPPRSAALSPAPFGNVLAKAENSQYIFASFGYVFGGLSTNYLYRWDAGASAFTGITLNAGMTGNPSAITGHINNMVLHRGHLFCAMQVNGVGSMNSQRYNIAANTWQDINGAVSHFVVLRGILYAMNDNAEIYSVTNEFAAGAATYTLVDVVGTVSTTRDVKEFNGAIYIAKPDGIFRFDGVKALKILELVTTKMQVFNGGLYFVSGKWLYKFDGVNVTRLEYFAEGFGGFTASPDYLFIATLQPIATYLTEDKFGTSFSATDSYRHIYAYDGAAFYLVDEHQVVNSSLLYSNIYYTGNKLIDYQLDNGTVSNYSYDFAGLFDPTAVTTASRVEITTSEFSADFPNIFKSLESIEVDYSDMIAGDNIQVGYQTFDGKDWSSWVTLGNLTSTTINGIEVTDATKKLHKKLKISLVVTYAAGSTLTVRAPFYRYTLQPRVRWRWQITLQTSGNGIIMDRAGTKIDTDSNALSNLVVRSIKQKTPLFMLAPDYGITDATVNAAALSFVVKGQIAMYADPYNDYPLVAVKNNSGTWEILRVSNVVYNAGTDKTTITVLERGYYGVTAAQLTAGAEVHPAYKVYVTRLLRENTVLSDETYAEQLTTGESQIQREFLLEITEV